MKKRRWLLLSALLLAVAGLLVFRPWQSPPRPWVPVLEETGFAHLDDALAAAAEAAHAAEAALVRGETGEAARNLRRTQTALARLQRYFLPMTEVRQLVYDADRLYSLEDVDGCRQKLEHARQQLLEVAASGGPSLRAAVEELIRLLDELLLAIDERSAAVAERFRAVGEKVNLMLLKGDLELAGSTFDR